MKRVTPEFIFKIVAVGDGGVGKTSLLRRFAHDKFEENYLLTLGVDLTTKIIKHEDKYFKLIICDTAGQEYYERLRPSYYIGCSAALIVYDVTSQKSFEDISKWIAELSKHLPKALRVLVGNKIDLEDDRVIEQEVSKKRSEELEMTYFETSAKLGKGVEDIFSHITEIVYKRELAKKDN